jgi:hypothetical protein
VSVDVEKTTPPGGLKIKVPDEKDKDVSYGKMDT